MGSLTCLPLLSVPFWPANSILPPLWSDDIAERSTLHWPVGQRSFCVARLQPVATDRPTDRPTVSQKVRGPRQTTLFISR